MRRDGSPSSLREALAAGRYELALYVAAAVLYVAVGVAFSEVLFSWLVATAYLVACVALLPTLVRLARR